MATPSAIQKYDYGMARTQKVTVTLPRELLEGVDRASESAGTTRSGLVASALQEFLRRAAEHEREDAWAESYRTHPPEPPIEGDMLLDSLPDEDWQ